MQMHRCTPPEDAEPGDGYDCGCGQSWSYVMTLDQIANGGPPTGWVLDGIEPEANPAESSRPGDALPGRDYAVYDGGAWWIAQAEGSMWRLYAGDVLHGVTRAVLLPELEAGGAS